MDHLQAIRIFARVVETGGFGRAALSLKMPNATVSKWIKSLEEHLGVKLLERSTRRVSVTSDGAAYYERTRHLLSELDDIEATLGRAQASPRGALRVDAGGSIASGIIIPAFARLLCATSRDSGATRASPIVLSTSSPKTSIARIRSTANDPALVTHPIGDARVDHMRESRLSGETRHAETSA